MVVNNSYILAPGGYHMSSRPSSSLLLALLSEQLTQAEAAGLNAITMDYYLLTGINYVFIATMSLYFKVFFGSINSVV